MTATMTVPGVVTITPRALEQVVRGIVRDLLGTPPEETAVDLVPGDGGLAVDVATLAPLAGDTPLVARLHDVRRQLATRVEELSGRHVASVRLRITGALARHGARVE
jgi:hypothetical protein